MAERFGWDFLGFLAPHGMPPVADPQMQLDGIHITTAPPWLNKTVDILNAHGMSRAAVEKQSSLRIVRTRADLEFRDATKVVFGLQAPPEDADVTDLRLMKEQGICITTIGYEEPNRFGSGFAHPDVGLTDDGKQFIRNLAQVGMVLDLSHASHATAWQALQLIHRERLEMQVVATHTGCYSVYKHPRNLPDDVLQGITEMGGFIGLYTLTFGLHESDNSLVPFSDHLRHARRLCGFDRIVLGSDGVYCYQDSESQKAQFEMLKAKIDPRGNFRARFPDQPALLNSPARMEVLIAYLSENYDRTTLEMHFHDLLAEAFFPNVFKD